MLWTRKDRGGQGHGSALVQQLEQHLNECSARLLIVETTGLDDFKGARAFYDKAGFTQEARIRNFFAAGDDKLIYTKGIG